MKHFLTKVLLMLFLSPFLSCSKDANVFTSQEKKLLRLLDFDISVISEIKKISESEIKQLPAIDSKTAQLNKKKYFNGVYIATPAIIANNYVKKNKSFFKNKGYLLFVFEGDDSKKNIAIIKGSNEMDILNYRKTAGLNYNLQNADIVAKMNDWNTKYGIIVVGCGRNWLEIEFKNLPKNAALLAKEVYHYGPDSINECEATISDLTNCIKKTRGIVLLWD